MTELRCRLITEEDSNDVLDWRNEFASRQMSINSRVISSAEHSKWFADMLINNAHVAFIGEVDSEKIGVVFMKIEKGSARVSINLAPLHRGKNLAVILLKNAMLEAIKLVLQIDQFIAEIKNTNKASIKVFTKCGFSIETKYDDISIYSLKSLSLGVKLDVQN